MRVVTTCAEMQQIMQQWRDQAVALVPTMGNLHAGHEQLIRQAGTVSQRVVVSIFVNPKQFDQASDFSCYPRTLTEDIALLESHQVDVVFAPDEKQMYPAESADTEIHVPAIGKEFCGRFRPGHFDGVCRVVARLFSIIPAQYALFGEKDYQQLLIIRQLVADLNIATEIIPVATVRDSDGVALSSRNQHLTAQQRKQAQQLYFTLQRAHQEFALQEIEAIEKKSFNYLTDQDLTVDYFNIRDAHTLRYPEPSSQHIVILTAASIGSTRLIDNILFPVS